MPFAAPFFLSAVLGAAIADPNGYIDRFKTIDSQRWLVSSGWSNGAWTLNDWQWDRVKPGPNGLTVDFVRSHSLNGYSSGEIQSRKPVKYGYFAARMTAASGSGIITGFFTYTGQQQHTRWNEIDVEILGKNTKQVQLTYHLDNKSRTTVLDLPFDAATEAHLYAFDWRAGSIRWYIDGVMVHEETGADVEALSETQKVYLDLWGSNSNPGWAGHFEPSASRIVATVRCVQFSPTKPSEDGC